MTDGRSVVDWGWEERGGFRGITKVGQETFSADTLFIIFIDAFLDVHICQVIQSSYFKYVKLIVCELYANIVVYSIKFKYF